MLDGFLPVALQKIKMLTERDDYIDMSGISINKIIVSFDNDRCTIDKFGKVEWLRDISSEADNA